MDKDAIVKDLLSQMESFLEGSISKILVVGVNNRKA